MRSHARACVCVCEYVCVNMCVCVCVRGCVPDCARTVGDFHPPANQSTDQPTNPSRFMVDEVRPAYGFFLRNTVGVSLTDVNVAFDRPDGRPCVVLQDAASVSFQRVSCQRDATVGLGYDVGLRGGNVTGVVLVDSPGLEVANVTTTTAASSAAAPAATATYADADADA